MRRVFIYTNVLFPFSIMDLMLALTEDGIHELIWTERLLTEWEDVVTRGNKRSPASARAITTAIREFFADGKVAEADYHELVDTMPGRDPDDRHHMAAAIAGRATAIVTWNLSDFPAGNLTSHGIRVIDPDEYLCELANDLNDPVVTTLIRLAGEKRNPPMSPLDLADKLDKAGAAKFAALARGHLPKTSDNDATAG